MTSRWYVLCSKPHKEQTLAQQLQSQGFEIYCPRYFEPNNKSSKFHIKPYFPGYLFVRFDSNIVGISKFKWMPNTEGLVSFGMKPAFIPDTMLVAIRRHVDQLNLVSGASFFSSDSDDNIETKNEDSRLNEYGAIFDPNNSTDERVRELLRMLQGLNVSATTRDT